MSLIDAIEALTPNVVNYEIRVVWPDGTPSHYAAIDVPLERAADVLETLADEIRAAVAGDGVSAKADVQAAPSSVSTPRPTGATEKQDTDSASLLGEQA